jgi:signal transduction histidine kinase
VLRTIADELVIAIQNALSIQEVKDLNAHLEQRIDAATKELRASNAQLQKLDEAKDEFISMASHQLRTPLTSIKGYVSMLMDGDVGEVSKEQKHLLEEAFMSSERMVRLIGDFLNVSRLQTGKFVIDKHPVDLGKIVGDEVESLKTNAEVRGLKFMFKKSKNIPKLNLDESKIQQVIMNFCDNAIFYSKDNSKIVVELAVVDNYVQFTVKDSGIGVPATEQDQLFTKFFRATNARKQRPDGTGVGLFLAKKVIDAHDGKIVFESQEGKGSTFGFRLPIKKV